MELLGKGEQQSKNIFALGDDVGNVMCGTQELILWDYGVARISKSSAETESTDDSDDNYHHPHIIQIKSICSYSTLSPSTPYLP